MQFEVCQNLWDESTIFNEKDLQQLIKSTNDKILHYRSKYFENPQYIKVPKWFISFLFCLRYLPNCTSSEQIKKFCGLTIYQSSAIKSLDEIEVF